MVRHADVSADVRPRLVQYAPSLTGHLTNMLPLTQAHVQQSPLEQANAIIDMQSPLVFQVGLMTMLVDTITAPLPSRTSTVQCATPSLISIDLET